MRHEVLTLPETQAGFTFKPVAKLLSDVRPVDWLVQGFIENDSTGLLFGDPETGKSLLALDVSLCCAAGLSWCGQVVEQGSVFYLAGEGHNGLARRVRAWAIRHEKEIHGLPFFVSECAASLYSQESALDVIQAIRALSEQTHEVPRLIVIDTLARNFGPANENSTEDMGQFIAHVDQIREQFKAAVLIVHHTGHGDKSRARGAYALTGAMDCEYRLEKGDDAVRLTCTKAKDFERPDPLAFTIRQVELDTLDHEGQPVTSVVMDAIDYSEPAPERRLGPAQQRALGILRDLEDQHRRNLEDGGHAAAGARVLITDWKDALSDAGELGKCERQNFSKIRTRLTEAGAVRVEGVHVFPA